MSEPRPRDVRDARVATFLAQGVRDGEIDGRDALRILRHELRRRNTNKKVGIAQRSVLAQQTIDRYAAQGTLPPKNGSSDALHADHVFPINAQTLLTMVSADDWLRELQRIRAVVCVTAAENYKLVGVEKQGIWGWEKYERAGVELLPLTE